MSIGFDHEAVALHGFPQIVHAIGKAMLSQQRLNRFTITCANLNHRAQLFVKQRRQTIFTQRVDISFNTAVTSEGHFRQRHQQATVGAIVVGQQLTLCNQRLNGVVEAFQLLYVTHIGRLIPS